MALKISIELKHGRLTPPSGSGCWMSGSAKLLKCTENVNTNFKCAKYFNTNSFGAHYYSVIIRNLK